MEQGKKKGLSRAVIILVILAVILLAVLLLSRLLGKSPAVEAGSFSVLSGGETVASFTMEEIKAMDSVECYVNLSSSSSEDAEGIYTGVPLRALVEAAGDDLLSGAEKTVAAAEDGYVMAYSAEEVAADDALILAYALDGESLGDMKTGSGPFRIIATADEFANRSLRWAVSLDVQ